MDLAFALILVASEVLFVLLALAARWLYRKARAARAPETELDELWRKATEFSPSARGVARHIPATYASPLGIPRNLLQESPPPLPPPAATEILPMMSETSLCPACSKVAVPESNGCVRVPAKVKPGMSVKITARPQRAAFRPEQIIIENGERWTINDVKIGNRSQFSQSGSVPGAVFAAGKSPKLTFETAQTAMDVVIVATYDGPEVEGEQFRAVVIGLAAL